MNGLSQVTLATINSGAAEELFQEQLQRVRDNIDDPNYKADAVRTIVLTVSIIPSHEVDKHSIKVDAQIKLPKREGREQHAFVVGGILVQGSDPRKHQVEIDQNVHQLHERQVV